MSRDFLFEIGCEEIPAHSQRALSTALHDQFTQTLTDSKLNFNEIKCYSLENGQLETEVDTLGLQISDETIRHVHSEQTRYSLQEKLEYHKKVWELVCTQ